MIELPGGIYDYLRDVYCKIAVDIVTRTLERAVIAVPLSDGCALVQIEDVCGRVMCTYAIDDVSYGPFVSFPKEIQGHDGHFAMAPRKAATAEHWCWTQCSMRVYPAKTFVRSWGTHALHRHYQNFFHNIVIDDTM